MNVDVWALGQVVGSERSKRVHTSFRVLFLDCSQSLQHTWAEVKYNECSHPHIIIPQGHHYHLHQVTGASLSSPPGEVGTEIMILSSLAC